MVCVFGGGVLSHYVCEIRSCCVQQKDVFHCCIIFHYMTIPHLFIHSTIHGHLSCFQFGLIQINLMNLLVHVFWKICAVILIGYLPRIAGIQVICFSRCYQTVFQSGCSNLCSFLQQMRVPIVSHSCQYRAMAVPLILAIPVDI